MEEKGCIMKMYKGKTVGRNKKRKMRQMMKRSKNMKQARRVGII